MEGHVVSSSGLWSKDCWSSMGSNPIRIAYYFLELEIYPHWLNNFLSQGTDRSSLTRYELLSPSSYKQTAVSDVSCPPTPPILCQVNYYSVTSESQLCLWHWTKVTHSQILYIVSIYDKLFKNHSKTWSVTDQTQNTVVFHLLFWLPSKWPTLILAEHLVSPCDLACFLPTFYWKRTLYTKDTDVLHTSSLQCSKVVKLVVESLLLWYRVWRHGWVKVHAREPWGPTWSCIVVLVDRWLRGQGVCAGQLRGEWFGVDILAWHRSCADCSITTQGGRWRLQL